MQTKKRAKPVKFGLSAKEIKAKEEIKKEAEKVLSANRKEEKEDEVEKSAEPQSTHADKLEDKSQKDMEPDDSAGSPLEKAENENNEAEEYFSSSIEELSNIESEDIESDDSKEEGDKKDSDEVSVKKEKDESADEAKESDEQEEAEEKVPPMERDGAFFSTPPDGYAKKKSMFPYFLKVMIITFVIGLVAFIGIHYSLSNKDKIFSFLQSPTPTLAPTSTPVPTEKPVDLALYSIRVLNGTGTAGLAAKLKSELTDAGFKVSSTGNADKADFIKTEIAAKKTVQKEYLDKLTEKLKQTYTLGTTSILTSGDSDVIVTIGSSSAK